jgi:hypothetical protein
VAHAAYLHTDVPSALGFLGTLLLTLRALERRSSWWFLVAGLALGLSLATKFTVVFLVPVLMLLVLFHALVRDGSSREKARTLLQLGLLLAAAGAALLLTYGVCLRSMTRNEAAESVTFFLRQRRVEDATITRVAALSRALPPAGHYVAGLVGVAAQNRSGGGINVLRGELRVEGFPSYFFVAFGVKSALSLLSLLLVAALLLVLRKAPFDLPLVVLVVPAAALFASGTWASYNIGVRHMLPAVPLLVAASVLTIFRALKPRAAVVVLAVFALGQVAETLSVHPHELSFFNAISGGPKNGERWLADSNVDWGQDLRRLGPVLSRLGIPEETLTIAYFGGAFPGYHFPKARSYDPVAGEVSAGVYAVSSYILTAAPELMLLRGRVAEAAGYEKLRRAVRVSGPPFGRVGYSIALYRIGVPGRPLAP